MASLTYVTAAPYFWQTMAVAVICAMLIGSVVHNGDLSSVNKAVVTLGTYATLLFIINFSRILDALSVHTLDVMNTGMAYASNVSLIMLTVFWVLGLWWGVFITKRARRRKV